MYAMRQYNYRKPNSWVSSGGLGTMILYSGSHRHTNGSTDRMTVVVVGDGCFQNDLANWVLFGSTT